MIRKAYKKLIQNNKFAIALLILFPFNENISPHLSFSNVYIDRFFHYSGETLFFVGTTILLGRLYFYINQSTIKYIVAILQVINGIILFIVTSIFLITLLESEIDSVKYYFTEKNEYQYYVLSKRRSALDDMLVNIYKEKKIFLFIKHREWVSKTEFDELNIDQIQLENEYWKFYSANVR